MERIRHAAPLPGPGFRRSARGRSLQSAVRADRQAHGVAGEGTGVKGIVHHERVP